MDILGTQRDRTGIRYGRLVVADFAGKDWNGYCWFTLWKCICDCGNELIVRGHNLGRSTNSCGCLRLEKLKKAISGKNHPRYKDGKDCGKNTKEILNLKEEIRKRDNYICQDCGISGKEHTKKFNEKLSVHHIDEDGTNNALDNMTTLCRACHIKLHKTKN